MDKFMEHTKAVDNNEKEQRRLEYQHEVMIYYMGKAVYPPVDFSKPGLKILDSGCANGRWLRDLKASSPAQHEYFGTDIEDSLYPSPPPEGMYFQNQSIKEEFPSEWAGSFDLVHQRFTMAGAAPGTMPPVVERLVKVLKPGGWMQLIEVNTDPNPDNGPMLERFIRMLREIFEAIGLGANFAIEMDDAMVKAGLINIHRQDFRAGHGAVIPDEVLAEKSLEGFPVDEPILQVLSTLPHNFSKEEFEGFDVRLRDELRERGGHSTMSIVWGQKPLE